MDLHGPAASGTKFRWKGGGLTIVSEIRDVIQPNRIVWTGRTMGIRAIHVWSFQVQPNGVLVHTEESFEGLLPRLFASSMTRMLATTLKKWLLSLKRECERRATNSKDGTARR
jgi:hypothetical protein